MNYEIKYTQDYCKHLDMTIIIRYVLKNEVIIKTKISGFYYGEPDLEGLETFKDKNEFCIEEV